MKRLSNMATWSPASAALAQSSHSEEGAEVPSRKHQELNQAQKEFSTLWLKERASWEGCSNKRGVQPFGMEKMNLEAV